MLDLAVVVINYRTPSMVIDCLASLLPELSDTSSSVVIVDNASGDDSVETIQDWINSHNKQSQVSIISSQHNGGFSSGNNVGVQSINAKYYLLLNSDTLIRAGAINYLLNKIKSESKAGLVTPRLEWPDDTAQESCFRFHSPVSEFISAAQTGFLTRVLNKYNVPIPVAEKESVPDWSSFACVLIRKDVIDEIGLMDEGYFMYFEDAEFCHRAKQHGWKVLNEPSARVVHLRGGSSPVKENARLKKRLPLYYYESRTRYFYQIYGWAGLTLANILWSAGRLISKTRQIFGRSDKAVSQRQWLDIWTNWLHPLKPYTHPDNYK